MYTADSKRYETMQYNRCGASGLKLPIVSLGYGIISVIPDVTIT